MKYQPLKKCLKSQPFNLLSLIHFQNSKPILPYYIDLKAYLPFEVLPIILGYLSRGMVLSLTCILWVSGVYGL